MSEELQLLTAMCEALDLKVERNVDMGGRQMSLAAYCSAPFEEYYEISERKAGKVTLALKTPIITYKVTRNDNPASQ